MSKLKGPITSLVKMSRAKVGFERKGIVDIVERALIIDRCACGCGRYVESAGMYARDFCRENHMNELNKEEPDIVY